MMCRRLLLGAGLWLVLAAATAEELYVQGRGAALLAAPAFDAERLTTVPTGELVSVVARKGLWLQVGYGDSRGWLPKLLLSTRPPVAKVSVFAGDDEQLKENARRRASAATTAGATRGLSAEDRERLHAAERIGYRRLEQLDDWAVSEDEAVAFVESGVSQ